MILGVFDLLLEPALTVDVIEVVWIYYLELVVRRLEERIEETFIYG